MRVLQSLLLSLLQSLYGEEYFREVISIPSVDPKHEVVIRQKLALWRKTGASFAVLSQVLGTSLRNHHDGSHTSQLAWSGLSPYEQASYIRQGLFKLHKVGL